MALVRRMNVSILGIKGVMCVMGDMLEDTAKATTTVKSYSGLTSKWTFKIRSKAYWWKISRQVIAVEVNWDGLIYIPIITEKKCELNERNQMPLSDTIYVPGKYKVKNKRQFISVRALNSPQRTRKRNPSLLYWSPPGVGRSLALSEVA